MNTKMNRGFSLITTMFLMGVISTLMAMLVFSANQRNFTARRLIDRIKATAYAEAGFEHALAELTDNWDDRYDAAAVIPDSSTTPAQTLSSVSGAEEATSAAANYGEGQFMLELTPFSNRYCLVQSTGICGSQEVEVEVLIEDFLADDENAAPGSSPDNSAWANTLFAAGTMDLGGNGDINGSVHANGAVKLNGNVDIGPNEINVSSSTKITVNGSVDMDGTLAAPSIRITGNNNSGAVCYEQAVASVNFPELDLTELYNTALANGQVINGNVKKSSDLNWSNIPGGVVWINGYLKVTANANLACTVVATGYINITGNANWDMGNTGRYNHIISRDSSIKIAGNAEVNGVLYAPGDIMLSGNARIYGCAVSGGDVDVNGNVEVINYDEASVADLVPIEQAPKETLVGISAWQK